jgi:hypothetical protein
MIPQESFRNEDQHLLPPPPPQELARGIERSDAEEVIEALIKAGERPIVTIKPKRLEETRRNGLQEHKDWTGTNKRIVGTLGVPPYNPEGDRLFVRINIDDPRMLQPRITGDKKFHGIVVFPSGRTITPDMFEIFESIEEAQKPSRIH